MKTIHVNMNTVFPKIVTITVYLLTSRSLHQKHALEEHDLQ